MDLKSSNILLDNGFMAKVANFSLARSVEDGEGVQLMRHVMGTQGYMAPEYIEHGLITLKLDVLAFGVVLLGLLSGKEAVYSKAGLAKMKCLLSGSIGEVVSAENVREKLKIFMDPCLRAEYPFDLAFAMAQLANVLCRTRSQLSSNHGVRSCATLCNIFKLSRLGFIRCPMF